MTDDSDPHPMTGAAIELAKERNQLLEELEALADEWENGAGDLGADDAFKRGQNRTRFHAAMELRELIQEYRGVSDE